MQRYLQPEVLEERGISNFDDWANLFADVSDGFRVQGVRRIRACLSHDGVRQSAGVAADAQAGHGYEFRRRHDLGRAAEESRERHHFADDTGPDLIIFRRFGSGSKYSSA